jgi:hypothetical protein
MPLGNVAARDGRDARGGLLHGGLTFGRRDDHFGQLIPGLARGLGIDAFDESEAKCRGDRLREDTRACSRNHVLLLPTNL